ncbi:hypothetical protein LOTGIDRAFT_156916, partial [Lottia gigantea]
MFRGLVCLFVVSVASAQFFGSTSPYGSNPNTGFNSIFGGGFSNPSLAYGTSPGLNGFGLNTANLGLNTAGLSSSGLYGTNGLYGSNIATSGVGYGSAATDGRIYTTETCNILFGSNSVLTFCSRFRQACGEILFNSSVASNTVRVCGG